IDAMLGRLAIALRGFLAAPEDRLASVDLLTPTERRLVLEDWLHLPGPAADAKRIPGSAFDDPEADRCLHRRFEAQVRTRPDAVAATCGTESLSYAELNGRANRLARQLRRSGIGPESLVGVHMDRSLDLVVAILGILKAGGAYLPLDEAAPARRLAFMLSD